MLRFGSRIDRDELHQLGQKQMKLKDWRNKIMTLKELQDRAAQGRLSLGLTPEEALRKMLVQTNQGKPEANYKEMLEESLIMMADYRTNGEVTARNYGAKETMEEVWTEVMSELQG